MTADYFPYQVSRVWYRVYWVVLTVCQMAIVGAWTANRFLPETPATVAPFGGGAVWAILGGIGLVYSLLGYWLVERNNLPLASVSGYLFASVALLYGMAHTAEPSASYVYAAILLLSVFFNGAYGSVTLAGTAFGYIVFAILQSDYQPDQFNTPLALLAGGSLVIAIAAHFFWKGRFESVQEEKVNQLSGMLKSNRQQSEILIRSIADGIIVTNTEGKITLINPAAGELTEWSVDEAMGLDVQLVAKLHREDGSEIVAEENPFALVLHQEKYINQTLELTGRKDKKLIISLVASPVIMPGNDKPVGAVAVMRDVSEAKAAEKQRAEFISTASHEMRTPVAAIEGYLALALNDKVSTIDSRAKSYLEKAHASTQHLGKLFQDLLTSSKAEDGRLNNHPVVTEMGAFMQQLSDDLKFAAEKKGLFVEFIVGGVGGTIDATAKDAAAQHMVKPLYYAHVDPERLREVITNLFDNACKYTDAGKISIGLTGNNEIVQLYIRDTGSGIPADDIPHLFQKFYRVDNSATRTIGGTGLGLFISRKIIELYRGRIWVESELGKGSTFFINLPRLSTQRANELQMAENGKTDPSVVNPAAPVNT